MKLAPGIHHFPTGPFNWYLIEEAGRLTLVDAGFPGHYSTLLRGLSSLGRSILDIEAIIVTHAHADHMGFAERVRRVTGAPLYMHQADVERAQHRFPLPWWGLLSHVWSPFMARMLSTAVVRGLVLQPGLREIQSLNGGESLPVPGRPVVFHVPGHTPGQIALYLPSQRALLSSDTLLTRDLITGRHGGPQLAHASLDWSPRASRRALQQFKELGDVLILPGHGRPWLGPIEAALSSALGQ